MCYLIYESIIFAPAQLNLRVDIQEASYNLNVKHTVENIEAQKLINRIQNIRKDKQFEVTDKINITIEKNSELESAVERNYDYICSETLADSLKFSDEINNKEKQRIELTEDFETSILVEKHN